MISDEQRIAAKVPNAETRRAMQELEEGKGKTYGSTAEMMKDFKPRHLGNEEDKA